MIGHDGNNRIDGDDKGVAISVAAESGTMTATVTTSQRAVIFSDAKSSLQAYFEEEEWPLNRAQSREADFFSGQLGEVVTRYQLTKMQVARQLLIYKKGKYLNTQVSILLNPSDLDKRLHDSMVVFTSEFVALTLERMCNPDTSSSGSGSDFNNLCRVIISLPSTARMYIWMVARSPENACFCLLVDVVENWIQDMVEKFPITAAGIPNAQLKFDREKEHKMGAVINDFIKEYESPVIPVAEMSSFGFWRLGTFIHLALFHAWSDKICNNEKPPIEFPTNCLVGRYALSVVYYVAGQGIINCNCQEAAVLHVCGIAYY
jgi:hypothetical protein